MNLRLSPLYSNGMILQRNTTTIICGVANPTAKVVVSFLGEEHICYAQQDGKWSISLEWLKAGGPYTIEIYSENEAIKVHNVLIGDVWLCGGQSNMEMKMQRTKHMYPEDMQDADNPLIRQFSVPQNYDFRAAKNELSGGSWETLSPENISDFSAVGYFFAKRLHKAYNVPIGIIAASVGGTPIHAWMSKNMLENFPDIKEEAFKYSDDDFVKSIVKNESERSEAYYASLDRSDLGLIEGWYNPDYDDKDWLERELVLPWDDDLEAPGIVWLRKNVYIPSGFAEKPATLFLGTIVDADTVFLNGVEIGSTSYRYPPREYVINSLVQGRCTIAIRVSNLYGNGGFTHGKQRLLVCEGKCIDLSGGWKYRRANTAKPHIPETRILTKPTGLYNGMIAPLHNFVIKGAIWYQGESDVQDPSRYSEKFESMVRGWRNEWGYDFPFIFTQLTHYGHTNGVNWDLLRKQQLLSLAIPNTGMIFTEDVGDNHDLHPMNKKDIGFRLARTAMRLAYGESMPDSPFEVCGLI